LEPSVDTVCVGGHEAIPESESAHVKFTATLELFHPLAFALGVGAAVSVGGVLSILTITRVVAVLPAVSVAVPETI
jgi:hypothetical protein